MKLSTKGQYGLEAMVDLAVHAQEGPVNLKSISARQNLPENYLEQIFIALRRGKLVDSIRGAQGGYVLARPASEISVLEVLNSLEGPMAPVACILCESKECCDRYDFCAVRTFWEKTMDALDSSAKSVTLSQLVDDYRVSSLVEDCLEYYI